MVVAAPPRLYSLTQLGFFRPGEYCGPNLSNNGNAIDFICKDQFTGHGVCYLITKLSEVY